MIYSVTPITTFFILFIYGSSNAQCPKNEVEVECTNLCNTCDNPGQCYPQCIPGCDCRAGFLRSELGICIPSGLCGGWIMARRKEQQHHHHSNHQSPESPTGQPENLSADARPSFSPRQLHPQNMSSSTKRQEKQNASSSLKEQQQRTRNAFPSPKGQQHQFQNESSSLQKQWQETQTTSWPLKGQPQQTINTSSSLERQQTQNASSSLKGQQQQAQNASSSLKGQQHQDKNASSSLTAQPQKTQNASSSLKGRQQQNQNASSSGQQQPGRHASSSFKGQRHRTQNRGSSITRDVQLRNLFGLFPTILPTVRPAVDDQDPLYQLLKNLKLDYLFSILRFVRKYFRSKIKSNPIIGGCPDMKTCRKTCRDINARMGVCIGVGTLICVCL